MEHTQKLHIGFILSPVRPSKDCSFAKRALVEFCVRKVKIGKSIYSIKEFHNRVNTFSLHGKNNGLQFDYVQYHSKGLEYLVGANDILLEFRPGLLYVAGACEMKDACFFSDLDEIPKFMCLRNSDNCCGMFVIKTISKTCKFGCSIDTNDITVFNEWLNANKEELEQDGVNVLGVELGVFFGN